MNIGKQERWIVNKVQEWELGFRVDTAVPFILHLLLLACIMTSSKYKKFITMVNI